MLLAWSSDRGGAWLFQSKVLAWYSSLAPHWLVCQYPICPIWKAFYTGTQRLELSLHSVLSLSMWYGANHISSLGLSFWDKYMTFQSTSSSMKTVLLLSKCFSPSCYSSQCSTSLYALRISNMMWYSPWWICYFLGYSAHGICMVLIFRSFLPPVMTWLKNIFKLVILIWPPFLSNMYDMRSRGWKNHKTKWVKSQPTKIVMSIWQCHY